MDPENLKNLGEESAIIQREKTNQTLDGINNSGEVGIVQREKMTELLGEMNSNLEAGLVQREKMAEKPQQVQLVPPPEDESAMFRTFFSMMRGPRGLQGEPGEPGQQGKPGPKGEDGYIPVKGKDYRDGIDGTTPKKGVDYYTAAEISLIKKELTPVKGKDYFDGEPGKPGQAGKNVSKEEALKIAKQIFKDAPAEELYQKIRGLLSFNDLNNLPPVLTSKHQASKTTSLSELDDVDISALTQVNGKYVLGVSGAAGSDTQVQFNDGGVMGGNNNFIFDKVNGRVGIGGVSAPNRTLTVGSGTGAAVIGIYGGSASELAFADGLSGNASYAGSIKYDHTTNSFRFFTNSVERGTWDTNGILGIGTVAPLTQTGNRMQIGDNSANNQYLVFQTNNGTERGIQYYLADGTTLRGFLKWDGEEDMLLKGDTFKFSTGSVADHMHLNDTGLGLRTLVPTHTLTLASTSTGIALYNTADQTTNFERGLLEWSSNELNLRTISGGTGTNRALRLGSRNASGNQTAIYITRSGAPFIQFEHDSTGSTGKIYRFTGGSSLSSSSYTALAIEPTIAHTGTAGYTALLINPTETTTGSGTKLLADFQVGGVSKLNIDNGGEVIQALGKYFRFNSDTNWRIGGVTATAPFTYSSATGNKLNIVIGSGATDGFGIGTNGGNSHFELSNDNGAYFRNRVRIPSVKGSLNTATDGATVTFNKNTSDSHNVVLGGNRTLALSNMAAGDKIIIRLTQDATGSRTVTWFTTIKWAGGSAPTLTTTANKADLFGFFCTSAGNYDGFVLGQNI